MRRPPAGPRPAETAALIDPPRAMVWFLTAAEAQPGSPSAEFSEEAEAGLQSLFRDARLIRETVTCETLIRGPAVEGPGSDINVTET